MARDLTRMGVAELERLHEDLWAALGPQRPTGKAALVRAVRRALRAAGAVRIRTVVDPLDQPGGGGGIEASKRYKLYEDGQTVADFILAHGDGPHLRLDVQRGNVRLVARRPSAPRKASPKAKAR